MLGLASVCAHVTPNPAMDRTVCKRACARLQTGRLSLSLGITSRHLWISGR